MLLRLKSMNSDYEYSTKKKGTVKGLGALIPEALKQEQFLILSYRLNIYRGACRFHDRPTDIFGANRGRSES